MHKSLLLAAALVCTPVLGTASTAHADGISVRIGGNVRVGGEVHVGDGHVRRARPHVRHRRHRSHVHVRARGHVSFGVRFAEPPPPPPPPPCDYECGAVPAYYTGATYAPPAPITTTVYAPAPEPLPRWAIGAFAGSIGVDDGDSGSDLGLLGRFRLSEHFQLEAEIAKSELGEGGRVDRRLGGALIFDFMPRDVWSVFALGGAGYGQTEMGSGSLRAQQGYGELGAGLSWRLGDSFYLVGDVRAGRRNTSEDVVLKTDSPLSIEDHEDYTRARLGALIYF